MLTYVPVIIDHLKRGSIKLMVYEVLFQAEMPRAYMVY